MANWPHQDRGKAVINDLRSAGVRSVVAAAPCGAGKSLVMSQLTQEEVAKGGSVKIYLHRTMLLEQLCQSFDVAGISYGIQAAGYEPNFDRPVQLCMLDTVYNRAVVKGSWDLGTPSLAMLDEAHNQTSTKARSVVFGSRSDTATTEGHRDSGAFVLGFSATPVNCGGFYDHLVGFATYKECRDVKAHLPIRVYSPSEIDCSGLTRNAEGEFSSAKIQERATKIVGDTYLHWRQLNPDEEPAILFAPSVEGSIWFALQWAAMGVPVAHLDGKICLLPRRTATGSIELEKYDATTEMRSEILRMSKSGEIKVLMNRFVLREAIDMPWLRHGIGATVFGGIATYLQSIGRIQRYCAGMSFKIWQDHGGCLDAQTQVLTKRGWLSQGEVVVGDEIAAFNMQTNGVEWKLAKSTYVREVNDQDVMHVIKSRCLDLRVTGNHKAIYSQRTCGSGDVARWPVVFKKARFDEITTNRRMRIPIAGASSLPGLNLEDHFIRFLGWWITDGTRCKTSVSVSQKESYELHVKDIRDVLELCGFDWTETTSRYKTKRRVETMIKFSIPKGTSKSRPRNGWVALERYLDKGIHPDLDAMDERQFGLFLHALHLGDGSKDRILGSYKISCGHQRMADTLQSMAVRRGWKCNITPAKGEKCMQIHLQKRTFSTIHGVNGGVGNQSAITLEKPIAGELVWCVENDLGTLVTRRNGKVAIVGNSYWRHGSPNGERSWKLGDTNSSIQKERIDTVRNSETPERLEGICCPKCHAYRVEGVRCPYCGWAHKTSARFVREISGELKLQRGVVNRPKKKREVDVDMLWTRALYRGGAAGMSVSSAVHLWAKECRANGLVPDASALRYRPPAMDSVKWHQPVSSVFPWAKPRKKANAESTTKETDGDA